MGKKKSKKNKSKPHNSPKPSSKRSYPYSNEQESLRTKDSYPGPISGLVNLGNTCFFNAVIQVIGQSHHFSLRLNQLLSSSSYSIELKLPSSENALKLRVNDTPGELTRKLNALLAEMQQRSRLVNPKPVFTEICKKATRFSGYNQQDSQELLRYLLDQLKHEEIHRIKRAILTNFGVHDSSNNQKNLTDKEKLDIKRYGIQALMARTFVDEVFGGMLVSTVKCKVCNDCSTMQESFLDLSLPIAEDESHVSYSGGYQTRGKKKKDTEADDEGGRKLTSKSSKEEPKISKHQKKKAEREAKKTARKSAKSSNTKSLKEFLKSSHSESIKTASPIRTCISPTQNPGPTEPEESAERDDREDKSSLDNETVDNPPAEGVTDSSNVQEGLVNYAASGPESDKEAPLMSQPEENNSSSMTPLTADTSVNGLSEGLNSLNLNNEASNVDIANSSVNEEATSTSEHSTISGACVDSTANISARDLASQTDDHGNSHHNTNDVDNKEEATVKVSSTENLDRSPCSPKSLGDISPEESDNKYKMDSLLCSLKKFCALEHLRGDNKFACSVCTAKLRKRTKEKSLKPTGDLKERGLPSSMENSNPSTCVSTDEEKALCHEERKTDESKRSCLKEIETDEGKTVHSESDSEDPQNTTDSTEPQIALCEATKQMLIQSPPLVLTLNLKRFSQQGRRLRKNSKYISFPLLLDLKPFCTNKCEAMCDSEGRLLYSLYGVVEHSGGMQGGHYVAYVKSRTIDPVTPTRNSGRATPTGSTGNVTPTEASGRSTPTGSTGNVAPTEASGRSTPTGSTGDVTPTEASGRATPTGSIDNVTPTGSSGRATPTENEQDATAAASSGEESSEESSAPTTPITHSMGLSKHFDLSSTKGHWFYASDSHIKTATEADVLKRQAYLLFYERLPLVT